MNETQCTRPSCMHTVGQHPSYLHHHEQVSVPATVPVKAACDNNCEAKGWMPGHAPECVLGGPAERAGTVGRSLTLKGARR